MNAARFHMSEGPAALLTVEPLHEQLSRRHEITADDLEAVREKRVFTTHTPVPAGYDRFSCDLGRQVLGDHPTLTAGNPFACREGMIDLTYLALNLARYVNGVAKQHGEVSQMMFADYQIDSITNGVHAATWTARPLAALFDQCVPGWRKDHFSLRYALTIPREPLWAAQHKAKRLLIERVNRQTNAGMDTHPFPIGFAG